MNFYKNQQFLSIINIIIII